MLTLATGMLLLRLLGLLVVAHPFIQPVQLPTPAATLQLVISATPPAPTPVPAGPTPPSPAQLPPSPTEPPLWQRFLTSAGFGGMCAVFVGAVGWYLSRRKYRNDRWWDTLTWVYDRAIVERDKKDPLPRAVAIAMLTELLNRAGRREHLQVSAIHSIHEMFSERDEAPRTGQGPALETASRRVDSPLERDLLEGLERSLASRGLPSRQAWRQYEQEVNEALQRVVTRHPGAVLAPAPRRTAPMAPDFTVMGPAGTVLIEVKYAARSVMNIAMLRDGFAALGRQLDGSVSGVLVVNVPVPLEQAAKVRHDARVRLVTWTGPQDDRALEDAVFGVLEVVQGGS